MTRSVPAALQAALDAGATTLARAWTVTRTDGLSLGFTDHDRPLAFDGVVHEAESGLTAEALEQATGLGIDSHGVEGAFRSAAITDADLERGLYDGAEIAFSLVDWTDPAARLLIARGRIATVRRGSHGFEAEIAGLSEALNQPLGRVHARLCHRRLGDAGCGVDLSDPAFRASASVTGIAGLTLTVAGLDGFASRWFDRGALTWETGANAGLVQPVRAHRVEGGAVTLALWQAPPLAPGPGDGATVQAGCDKSAETCRGKFSNLLNFGGFPHMPGEDWATTYPNTGGGHDGGSLFRG